MKLLPCRIRSDHAIALPFFQWKAFGATATSFCADKKSGPPEMSNTLLVFETAFGLLTVRDVIAFRQVSILNLPNGAAAEDTFADDRRSRCFNPSVMALWLSKKEPLLASVAT
jgi:hypothetical protein